jgi:hypothetical protein
MAVNNETRNAVERPIFQAVRLPVEQRPASCCQALILETGPFS